MPRVVKSNDVREPFNEDKLRSGMLKALEKRPVSSDDVEMAVNHIKTHLRGTGEREVPSKMIGNLVMEQLKNDPDSRRIIVSAWNVGELNKMALAPCHAFFQFYVADGKLSCQLYQRSCDVFLGLPFNIASYALLVHMVAQQCDLEVGDFVWTGGDTHLYSNHMEQTRLQLTREPRPLPKLVIKRKPASLFDYRFEDFEIEGYDPHPAIKAPVAI